MRVRHYQCKSNMYVSAITCVQKLVHVCHVQCTRNMYVSAIACLRNMYMSAVTYVQEMCTYLPLPVFRKYVRVCRYHCSSKYTYLPLHVFRKHVRFRH